jgi:biopolymer transport protein ExbD
MSHGASSEVRAEPNLVPLLDLVLQLIMFFMICLNFVNEQFNNEDIILPFAQSARPMDKGEVDVLFLNMDAKGSLIVPGKERPLRSVGDKQLYLRQAYGDAKNLAELRGDKSGKVNTAIIIRADRGATYGQIYELLRLCKDTGYHKLQLRAMTKTGA